MKQESVRALLKSRLLRSHILFPRLYPESMKRTEHMEATPAGFKLTHYPDEQLLDTKGPLK
jgi:hypothetical protein